MEHIENDIGTLIELKCALKNALEKGDKDEIKTSYNRFRNLYKKITGKDFEVGLSVEKRLQIESVITDTVSQTLTMLDASKENEI